MRVNISGLIYLNWCLE